MAKHKLFRTDYEYATAACARLRAFRSQSGFTVSDVAEHLKIPTSLYVIYEEYELVPQQLIVPLCQLLNMSPWHYLAGFSDE